MKPTTPFAFYLSPFISNRVYWCLMALILGMFLEGCKKEQKTTLTLHFTQCVDNQDIIFNTQYYSNAAGNEYLINELKYFISNISLRTNKKDVYIVLQDTSSIFYIDAEDKNTSQQIFSKLPVNQEITSVCFTFGLYAKDNISNLFLNPPQSQMAWSSVLGGGYHFLMLNGKFKQGDTILAPLNIHLGRGQIYAPASDGSDSIVGFVDNDFTVEIPCSFTLSPEKKVEIELKMDVNKWFSGNNVYDFNVFGSHIMQNQNAMNCLKLNGLNAFSIKIK
ncbi:MAG: hypothetical protein LBR36_09300 [Bacteroidales bacterium]|jgi:hypothetical protein|nr:hypothetical protein [Bacteroidales bacterium]